MAESPSTFAEVEKFVTMLQAACENASMSDALQGLPESILMSSSSSFDRPHGVDGPRPIN